MAKERDPRVREISPEWQARVRAEIAKGPRGTHARVAEGSGITAGQLSDLLAENAQYSRHKAAVDRYFRWDEPPTTSQQPAKGESEGETEWTIRRNMIRFREEAGYDQLGAADAAEIPFETLRSFELGTVEPPNAVLVTLAKVYGHRPGDFFEADPPRGDPNAVPWIHFRVHLPAGVELSEEDKARLADTAKEIDQKYRVEKQRQLEHFKKARTAKRKTA